MPTIREMLDRPAEQMGLQNAVGIDIQAGGPGSGRHAGDIARQLKLPKGAGHKLNDNNYSWNKKGGYADSVMSKVHDAATAAGFTRSSVASNNADGSQIGHGNHFTNGEWHLQTHSSFGPTKDSNYHSIYLHREGQQPQ